MSTTTACRTGRNRLPLSAVRSRPTTIALLALASLFATAAFAQDSVLEGASCTAARSERIDALTTIGLVPVDFPAELAELASDAARLWNLAPCAAADRPRFVLGGGERTIVVRWIAGASPVAPGICGGFSRSEIRLYAFARDPERRNLVPCGDRDRLVEILAHELGHSLGLFDQRGSGCANRIMGQLVRRADGSIAPRAIHADECRAVDQRFLTLAERLERTVEEDPWLADVGESALTEWGFR